MARYIDEILQPGEKVLYSTNAHWMFYLPAIGAWIAVAILLILSFVAAAIPALMLVCWASAAVVAIAALFWTLRAWFHRWTTETDVTIMGVGEGRETLSTIASPLAFRSAITTR